MDIEIICLLSNYEVNHVRSIIVGYFLLLLIFNGDIQMLK